MVSESVPAQALSNPFKRLSLKPDGRGVALFVGVPLVLAAITATTSGYSDRFGLGGAFFYVALLSIIPWWIGELTTRLAWFSLSRFQPPLWVLCLIGIALACIFVGPLVPLVTALFVEHWPLPEQGQAAPIRQENGLMANALQIGRAAFFWVTANYIFDRLLDYPRFRYGPKPSQTPLPIRKAEQTTESTPELLKRLTRFNALSDIIIVNAEEHYVRVIGADAQELVAYKFGSAISDLSGQDGFQVHRSHWVRKAAVIGEEAEGNRLFLRIKTGHRIPVSGRYRALVDQVIRSNQT